MNDTSELLRVGTIGGAYGVRGEVRLKSFCANPEDIDSYAPLLSEDGSEQFSLQLIGAIKNGFSARILGVETKEQADALRGTGLFVRRDQLAELPDDEFYYSDLTGLEVVDTGGGVLGKVKTVVNHGAGDLLEVQIAGSSATTFLPFTKDAVPTVDLKGGRIVADPPEGLF